jgi:HEPN domain-containing protein
MHTIMEKQTETAHPEHFTGLDHGQKRAGGYNASPEYRYLLQQSRPEAGKTSRPVPNALQRMLNMIIVLMEPDKIFLLGAYKKDNGDSGTEYDLLISVSGKDARPHHDYVIILEHISLKVYPVTAIVINSGSLCKMLAAGHIYYSRVCRSRNLLFDAGIYPLPVPGEIPVNDMISRARMDFENRSGKAASFLKCSRHFLAEQQKGLAAFLLHQSVEQTCHSVLQGLTAKETVTHNLRLLMENCRRCAPELRRVFVTGREEDERRLGRLQKAYINTRYKPDYEISDQDLETLMAQANHLLRLAKDIFNTKIQEAARALSRS